MQLRRTQHEQAKDKLSGCGRRVVYCQEKQQPDRSTTHKAPCTPHAARPRLHQHTGSSNKRQPTSQSALSSSLECLCSYAPTKTCCLPLPLQHATHAACPAVLHNDAKGQPCCNRQCWCCSFAGCSTGSTTTCAIQQGIEQRQPVSPSHNPPPMLRYTTLP